MSAEPKAGELFGREAPFPAPVPASDLLAVQPLGQPGDGHGRDVQIARGFSACQLGIERPGPALGTGKSEATAFAEVDLQQFMSHQGARLVLADCLMDVTAGQSPRLVCWFLLKTTAIHS
jgi:hypothetical protein